MSNAIDTIIFDLGGVLIDWNPRYLYRKIFGDEEEMEAFLKNVCHPEWNNQQDAGRSFKQGTDELIATFPHYTKEITAYDLRWEEMLGEAIHDTLDLLNEVASTGRFQLYALTNWSHEKFPIAKRKFSFLEIFEGILVSGEVKLKKPDPEIFELCLTQFGISPARAIFIDDSLPNIKAAEETGIKSIHFQSASELRANLRHLSILAD